MKSVTANELYYIYNENNDIIIIDIRNRFEFAKSHIPGSYNVSFDNIINNFLLYFNKEFTYYIICNQGILSKKACSFLENKGYHVINILDGFDNWKGKIEGSCKFNH